MSQSPTAICTADTSMSSPKYYAIRQHHIQLNHLYHHTGISFLIEFSCFSVTEHDVTSLSSSIITVKHRSTVPCIKTFSVV